jgi:hypothetical protein
MPDPYDYHTGKLPDFTYVSKIVDPAETSTWFDASGNANPSRFRMVSHVFDFEDRSASSRPRLFQTDMP